MKKLTKLLPLSEINKGERFEISEIEDQDIRLMSTRLGVCEGQVLKCIHKSKNGPLILQNIYQEIALGFAVTKKIKVKIV